MAYPVRCREVRGVPLERPKSPVFPGAPFPGAAPVGLRLPPLLSSNFPESFPNGRVRAVCVAGGTAADMAIGEAAPREFGDLLRDARTRRGIPVAQAAHDTCISMTYLEALEAGAPIQAFPAPVYARGFLREYARYLGLDERPLLEQLDRTGHGVDPAIRASSPSDHTADNRLRRWWSQRASGLGG